MTMQTTKRPLNTHEISASTSSERNSTAFKNTDITVYSPSVDVYIKFGDSSVTATTTAGTGYDKLIPAGALVDLATGGATHLAVITASASGTVYLNEWTHRAL